MPVEEQYRDVGGHRLRILTNLARSGMPLLVFNGIGASADLLRPLLTRLETPTLTFDLPGLGGSTPARVPQRMPQLASLASDVLDALAIPACHVMGVSWGGALAQQFARQSPERTGALVLAATSTGHLMVPPSPLMMLRMATPLRYLSADYFLRIAGDLYGGDFRRSPERARQHVKLMTPPTIGAYAGQLYALAGWTSLFWLHEITAPTLVMAGNDDPIVPLANARLLAKRLPSATLSVYDCGHLFVLTRLERVARDIDTFLASAELPTASQG